MRFYILFSFSVLFSALSAQSDTLRIAELLDKMDSSISVHHHLTFDFYKEERCIDHNEYSISEVKLDTDSSYQVYMKSNSPRDGMEILYREGENNGQVLINPNSFPFFNMNLDPNGSLIRHNQHHQINDLGFFTLQQIFAHFREAHADSLDDYLVRHNDYVWEETPVYKIRIEYTPFGFYDYTVKEGQTLDSIANELFVSSYMILEANEEVDSYTDISPGQVIKVPNNYGKVCEIFLDKKTYLPIRQVIWDEKGLFEKYEYKNVTVNPKFEVDELKSTFKEYQF